MLAVELEEFLSNSAFRSDCSKFLPMLVFVVVKNIRAGLRMFPDDAFLPGIAIAGAKAPLLFRLFRHD